VQIDALIREFRDSRRPLETYLRALHALMLPFSDAPGLTREEFERVLRGAFTAAPTPYDPAWEALRTPDGGEWDFTRLSTYLLVQVCDLRAFDFEALFADPWTYVGVKSPHSGTVWMNLSVRGYLDGAAATLEDEPELDWLTLTIFVIEGQMRE
jgi:hypothetical protein